MDRNGFVAVFLLLFVIVADVSDASLLSNLRKLVGVAPKDNSSGTPLHSPSPSDETKKNKDGSQKPSSSTKVNPVSQSPNVTSSASPPSQSGATEKKKEKKKKEEDKSSSENVISETCDGSVKKCSVSKKVVACIKSVDNVSREIIVLNQGESSLKANISIEGTLKELDIPKQQSGRISITLSNGKSSEIIINAANGTCRFPKDSSPIFGGAGVRLPSYDQLVTPINGAYFLILSVLIFGATWACCKLGKRRREDGPGVPYQELEMGTTETVSATDLETVEGWDQGWDDDWDEDKAVKSPRGHLGSISANGLTSRSTNKDGWEINWDD